MAAGGGGISGREGAYQSVYETTRMFDFLYHKGMIDEDAEEIPLFLFRFLRRESNRTLDEIRTDLENVDVSELTDSEFFQQITELFHIVVGDTHGPVCENIYKLHGKPEGDPEYGAHHFYDSSFDLIAAILLTQHPEDTASINYAVSHLVHGPEAQEDSTWERLAEESPSWELSDKIITAIEIVEYANTSGKDVRTVLNEMSGIAWLLSGLEEGDPQKGEKALTETGIHQLALRILKDEEFVQKIYPLFPDATEEDLRERNLVGVARADIAMARDLFSNQELLLDILACKNDYILRAYLLDWNTNE